MATNSVSSAWAGVALLALACSANGGARAGELEISGSVAYGPDTPVFSNRTIAFSFRIHDTIVSNPTSDVSNFHFSVDGVALPDAGSYFTKVEFWSAASAGMFTLFDTDNDTIDIYGAQVLNGLTLSTGAYVVAADVNASNWPAGMGSGDVTIQTIPVVSAPEASTWLMLLAGFAGLGLAARRAAGLRSAR